MNKRGRISSLNNFFPKNHRGQITIFIILGVIIVGVAALIYFLYPQIQSTFFKTTDPQGFIQTCVEDKIKETISTISLQGGSVEPQHYFSYYNEELQKLSHVEYLCYTNKDFQPCSMQQPVLHGHIMNEIKKDINQIATSCFNSLKKNYEDKGYSTNLVKGETVVDILPERVVVTFNNELTLTKGNTQRYEKFSVLVNNNLYELSGIANSILNWEVQYGDAETGAYMFYYHNLLVEKKEQSDGTKVYILTDLNTNDVFQFATRSFAWPPGYGGNI
jgi:hypothetical protein